MVPSLLPRREVEEGNSEAWVIVDYYNLLLYNAAATSAALLLMLYALCITVGYPLLVLEDSCEDASLR